MYKSNFDNKIFQRCYNFANHIHDLAEADIWAMSAEPSPAS
ncbi:hypothetical protein [Gilliamella sp. Nev5-1]|nr:hypothetical protein [Gilliamella apicola]